MDSILHIALCFSYTWYLYKYIISPAGTAMNSWGNVIVLIDSLYIDDTTPMLLENDTPIIHLQFINFNYVWNNWSNANFQISMWWEMFRPCQWPLTSESLFLRSSLLPSFDLSLFSSLGSPPPLFIFATYSSLSTCNIFIYTSIFYLYMTKKNHHFLNFISVIGHFMKWKCNYLQNVKDT